MRDPLEIYTSDETRGHPPAPLSRWEIVGRVREKQTANRYFYEVAYVARGVNGLSILISSTLRK